MTVGPVHAGDGDTADGDVPASMLAAQMQVLNTAFAPLGMSFVVAGIEKFSNASVRGNLCPALHRAGVKRYHEQPSDLALGGVSVGDLAEVSAVTPDKLRAVCRQ